MRFLRELLLKLCEHSKLPSLIRKEVAMTKDELESIYKSIDKDEDLVLGEYDVV